MEILIILAVIFGILIVGGLGWGLFLFLVQVGVIVQKAGEAPTTDNQSYSLDKSRDASHYDS
jgi:hypothetical protein